MRCYKTTIISFFLVVAMSVLSCKETKEIDSNLPGKPGTTYVGPSVVYHPSVSYAPSCSPKRLDVLLVIDNGISMADEQQTLPTRIYSLINALLHPLSDGEDGYKAPEDVQIAVTTTDMALQVLGQEFTGAVDAASHCDSPLGNNGELFDEYLFAEVNLQESTIPCDASAIQCPPGWSCLENQTDDSSGYCVDENSDGTSLACPQSPSELGVQFISTRDFSVEQIALATACVSAQGTQGCAVAQSLLAVDAGLKPQNHFLRPFSHTAVIVISDKDDCTLADEQWHEIATLDASLDTRGRNITCGEHSDLLADISALKQGFLNSVTEATGNDWGVYFAAIVGVPPVPACQGFGSGLNSCMDVDLEHGTVGAPGIVEKMDSNGDIYQDYESVCSLSNNENEAVIDAVSGKRFVEMAQQFSDMSYVHSICNADWSPVAKQITQIFRSGLCGSPCLPNPLPWSEVNQAPTCNFVLAYTAEDGESDNLACPSLPAGQWSGSWMETEFITIAGETKEYKTIHCMLAPTLWPQECDQTDSATVDQFFDEEFGWYYCEKNSTTDDCQWSFKMSMATLQMSQDARSSYLACIESEEVIPVTQLSSKSFGQSCAAQSHLSEVSNLSAENFKSGELFFWLQVAAPQCELGLCLSTVEIISLPEIEQQCGNESSLAACANSDAVKEDSLCTCRCSDQNGNTAEQNAELCVCPTGYTCEQVLSNSDQIASSLVGGYCVPQ